MCNWPLKHYFSFRPFSKGDDCGVELEVATYNAISYLDPISCLGPIGDPLTPPLSIQIPSNILKNQQNIVQLTDHRYPCRRSRRNSWLQLTQLQPLHPFVEKKNQWMENSLSLSLKLFELNKHVFFKIIGHEFFSVIMWWLNYHAILTWLWNPQAAKNSLISFILQ